MGIENKIRRPRQVRDDHDRPAAHPIHKYAGGQAESNNDGGRPQPSLSPIWKGSAFNTQRRRRANLRG